MMFGVGLSSYDITAVNDYASLSGQEFFDFFVPFFYAESFLFANLLLTLQLWTQPR